MRLLVIGMPLPNQRVDNYSFFSAPSFFDYDAVVIDPAAIVKAVDEVLSGGAAHATAADEPIVNSPTAGLNVGLADMIRRRRDETERLLARGGTVAVFARPNQPLRFVAGMPGADQYSWLPTPAGFAYAEPYLVPAFGTQVLLTDSASPLASFISSYERWFHYRAYFSEHVPEFAPAARVFARSIGGAVVGVRFAFGRGQVFFLPAMYATPEGDPRFNLATTLFGCLTQSVHAALEDQAPEWVSQVTLPGIALLEAAHEQATQQLEDATRRHEDTRTQLDQVARFRRLLWQEGPYGLDTTVRDAFQVLGFTVNIDVDVPAVLEADDRIAFLEVEGSQEAVVEWPYFRLQKRLERDLIETQQPKKGVIVVNGQRLSAPGERSASHSNALRVAAENYRYALLTSEALLDLVREAKRHSDDSSRQRLRDLVFEMVGDTLPEGFPVEGTSPEVPLSSPLPGEESQAEGSNEPSRTPDSGPP